MRRRRPIAVLALAAVATFVAVAATAAPPKSPAPVVPEIYPTQSPPKVDKRPEVWGLPPTAKPATNITVSPAGVTPAPGEDLSKPFVRRTFRGNGKCWVGKECILIGRRFGDPSKATAKKPFGYRIDVTPIKGGPAEPLKTSVWREDLIIFKVGSKPGKYSLAIRDASGRQLSNPYIVEFVEWRNVPDADGDGERSIEHGGFDCDDLDPLVHPGATERVDDE